MCDTTEYLYMKKKKKSKRKQNHSYITYMSMICFHVFVSHITFTMSNINFSTATKMISYSNSFHLFLSRLLVTAAITCDVMSQCLKVWKCLLTYNILHIIPKEEIQHN
jgi:membrane-associated HD superfamily phosphohydrolase